MNRVHRNQNPRTVEAEGVLRWAELAHHTRRSLRPGLGKRLLLLARPSLALSVDLAGTILAADAAVELAERYEYPSGGAVVEPREEPAPLLAFAAQRSVGGRTVSAGITAEYLYTALGHTGDEADDFYDLVPDGPLAVPGFAATGFGTLPAVESAANELALLGLAPLELYARWAVAWGPSRRSELGLAGTLSEVALGSRINF